MPPRHFDPLRKGAPTSEWCTWWPARAPDFMKIAPIVRALDERRDAFHYRFVHTGQHYDREMSDVFFEELGIPKPDYHLEAGEAAPDVADGPSSSGRRDGGDGRRAHCETARRPSIQRSEMRSSNSPIRSSAPISIGIVTAAAVACRVSRGAMAEFRNCSIAA